MATPLRWVAGLLVVVFLGMQLMTVKFLWKIDHGVQQLHRQKDGGQPTKKQQRKLPKQQKDQGNDPVIKQVYSNGATLKKKSHHKLPPEIKTLMETAYPEKKALQQGKAKAKVLVVSPLGETSVNKSDNTEERKGYKQGRDDAFTLKCSLQVHGYPPLIPATFDDRKGYDSLDIKKVQAISTTLQQLSSEHPTNTLVVVVDAFDVVIQHPPDILLERYNQQPYPIAVGGETFCWDPASGNRNSNVSTPFCTRPLEQSALSVQGYFLNSGVMMGPLHTLTQFLDYALQNLPSTQEGLVPWPGTQDQYNDQAYWGYWYTQYHPLIGLADADEPSGHLNLVANLIKMHPLKRNFKKETGLFQVGFRKPAIVHFPGATAKEFPIYGMGMKYYREQCNDDGSAKATA